MRSLVREQRIGAALGKQRILLPGRAHGERSTSNVATDDRSPAPSGTVTDEGLPPWIGNAATGRTASSQRCKAYVLSEEHKNIVKELKDSMASSSVAFGVVAVTNVLLSSYEVRRVVVPVSLLLMRLSFAVIIPHQHRPLRGTRRASQDPQRCSTA